MRCNNPPLFWLVIVRGGAVITQAINQCGSRVQGLVYVAAVVPLNDETPFQSSNQDNANFDKCATLDTQNNIFQINFNGPIREMFMADASPIQAGQAIHNMVPEPDKIGGGRSCIMTIKFLILSLSFI